MPHALVELGACAGFSQGYRRGLCREEQEKETMQQQSTRNKVSTGLVLAVLTLRNALFSVSHECQNVSQFKTCELVDSIPNRTFSLWLSLSLAASFCCSDNRSSKRSPLTPGFLPSSEPAGIRAMYPLPHPWALDHTKVGSGRRSGAHCDEATKSPLVLSTAFYARFARGNHKDNKA